MKMKQNNLPVRVALGAAIGAAVAFALSLLGGILLANGTIPEHAATFAAVAAAAMGAVAAALISGGKAFRLIGALCSAFLMMAVLLGLHAAVFGKSAYQVGVPAAVIPAAALLIGLIRIKEPRRRVKYR